MSKSIFCLILVILIIKSVCGQIHNANGCNSSNIEVQKLYLQFDRDFYFLGDTVWFSGFLLNGTTQKLISGHQNLHLDLIDSSGVLIKSALYPIIDGSSEGTIILSDSTFLGNNVLRAYTNYQRNFGEESYFYKTLSVDKNRSSLEMQTVTEQQELCSTLSVNFYPEGGILLVDILNVVGVEILDENGRGVNTNGTILNKENKVVGGFTTFYNGVGKFCFVPDSESDYKVIIDAFPDQQFNFFEVSSLGTKLQVVENDKNGLDISIFSGVKNDQPDDYVLACMNRGEVVFQQKIRKVKMRKLVKIPKKELAEGINRFVLFDENLNPVSERLYFNKEIKIDSVRINCSQPEYPHRSLVKLNLAIEDEIHYDSKVTITVVDENSLSAFGRTENLMSYLYLNSELLGKVNLATDYFEDSQEVSSSEKLDLLMLTHGWSRYNWNYWNDLNPDDLKFPVEAGIHINGYVKKLFGNKRVADSEVIACVKNDSLYTYYERADDNGIFTFSNLYVEDSTEVVFQARKPNESENTRIVLEPVEYVIPSFRRENFTNLFSNNNMPLSLYWKKFYAELNMQEFEPDKNSIVLEEVEVEASYWEKQEVKFSQIYSEADYSVEPKGGDFLYENLEEMLFAKAPTVFGSKPPGSIKTGTLMAIYIDGVPIMSRDRMRILNSISILHVDRVDIIKRSNPTGTALLGVRGSNGAIFIYTKRGIPDQEREWYLKGVLKEKIKGFAKHREFYSPVYTSKNIDSKRPDHRTTLYWNPSVEFEDGKAEISFYTSDDIARYKIIVEGISSNGVVSLGESSFEVMPARSN